MLASALDVEIVTHGGSAVGSALGAARLGALSAGAPMVCTCLPPPVDTVYQPDPDESTLLAARHALFRSLYRRP